MGNVIAITGKGGTGKTTIAALIVRIIVEKKLGSVLAVDADPNSNLAQFLGVEAKENIGSIIDDIANNPSQIPSGMPKDRFIEYRIQSSIEEQDGFDILTMGRPEGPGCYCYANNVLRNILSKLINDYKYIIIDNEAGLEHFSRRTTRQAEVLLVISDGSAAGIRTARRICGLIKELNIKTKKRYLIVNRNHGRFSQSLEDIEFLGNIPEDKEIEEINASGNSFLKLNNDNTSLNRLRELGDKIWH